MSDTKVLDRTAGRVILLDENGRVLLFHGFDPAAPDEPWWFTPGGGLEPGESIQEAAARELREETGLTVAPQELGEAVFDNYVEFSFDGVLLRQRNYFFRLHTRLFEVSTAGFEEMEQRTTLGHRWWSGQELSRTTETFFPEELVALLS